MCSPSVLAQAIKIGRFDFQTVAGMDLIYSTNVEQVPDGPTTDGLERKDYYYIARLSLSTSQDFNPNSTLSVGAGAQLEKHFVRDDLDTKSEPFGEFNLTQETSLGRYDFTFFARYSRRATSEDSTFVPGGRQRRDVNTITAYGGDVAWAYERLTLDGGYRFEKERHEDAGFSAGDEDRQNYDFSARWMINRRFDAVYDYTRERTKLKSAVGFSGWEETQFAGFEVLLLDNPELRYRVGMEKEDDTTTKGSWELIHTFTLRETYDFTKTVTLSITIDYTIEEERESDDTGLIYSIILDHILDPLANHSLTFTREPRDTFGSNLDTDTTRFAYQLAKEELLVKDLSFSFSATYDIDRPVMGAEEKTKRYVARLSNARQLSRKLTRRLAYVYDYEESNITTPIEEHRVELSLDYTF